MQKKNTISLFLFNLNIIFCFGQQSLDKILYDFSADGKECNVYNSHLKRPWLNRLSNDFFFTWANHDGYIESFLIDPVYNGLINPQKVSGHFYIKDETTGNYFLLNDSKGTNDWKGIIGLGYNSIEARHQDIEAKLNYLIPREDNVLLTIISIKNNSTQNKSFSVFSQVEWSMGDAVKNIARPTDGVGGSQLNLYKRVQVLDNIMYAEQNNWRSTATCNPWPYIGYLTSNENITSFETFAGNFIGSNGTWQNPKALEKGFCSNKAFLNYDEFPIGVLQNKITVTAGATKKLVIMLGMERDKAAIEAMRKKYHDPSAAEAALQTVKEYYSDFLSRATTVATPDKENDRILNIWSHYHWRQSLKKDLDTDALGSGFWAYGLEGENLTLHPEMTLVGLEPEMMKNSLIKLNLETQSPDTSKTVFNLNRNAMLDKDLNLKYPPEIKNQFSVPHHHNIYVFLFTLYYYLLETGDFDFLNEEVFYVNGTKASVFDHIETGIYISIKGLSERNLPKIPKGVGDYMDEFSKISKDGNAESVMLAAEIAYILKAYAEIAYKTNRKNAGDRWMAVYEKIKTAVNQYAWDGEWYIRAFADSKPGLQPVGSKQNEEGKIFLNAQSWPVISGIATPERATQCLDAVKKYLMSDYGPLIAGPAYTHYVDYIGTLSIYAPGFRNGNIYFRPTGWAIMAAVMAGKTELANELYMKTCVSEKSCDMNTYLLEPYVYAENYVGPDHQSKGEAQFHWCYGEGTGWMWYAYTAYILGVRAALDGLLIDPKIPAEWPGFKMHKPFRGAVYEIEVKNPNKVASGVKTIIVDGKKIKGNIIIPHKDGKTHKVEVMMGK